MALSHFSVAAVLSCDAPQTIVSLKARAYSLCLNWQVRAMANLNEKTCLLGVIFLELSRLDRRVYMTKVMIVFIEWCAQRAGREEVTHFGASRKAMKRCSPICDAWRSGSNEI